MSIGFEKVFERDIDLLVINKFNNDNNFKEFFLNRIGFSGFDVIDSYHSLSDKNGESDITIILEKDDEKIGILIEDKIDAIAMPRQKERYDKRGNKGISKGLYDKYYLFIIAPKDYLDTNLKEKFKKMFVKVLEVVVITNVWLILNWQKMNLIKYLTSQQLKQKD